MGVGPEGAHHAGRKLRIMCDPSALRSAGRGGSAALTHCGQSDRLRSAGGLGEGIRGANRSAQSKCKARACIPPREAGSDDKPGAGGGIPQRGGPVLVETPQLPFGGAARRKASGSQLPHLRVPSNDGYTHCARAHAGVRKETPPAGHVRIEEEWKAPQERPAEPRGAQRGSEQAPTNSVGARSARRSPGQRECCTCDYANRRGELGGSRRGTSRSRAAKNRHEARPLSRKGTTAGPRGRASPRQLPTAVGKPEQRLRAACPRSTAERPSTLATGGAEERELEDAPASELEGNRPYTRNAQHPVCEH